MFTVTFFFNVQVYDIQRTNCLIMYNIKPDRQNYSPRFKPWAIKANRKFQPF